MSEEETLYLAPERCEVGRPRCDESLLDLYGLRTFANSLARQDSETQAKRKLRKSYKNHIADLPGRHPIPGPGESQWTLLDAALRSPPASVAEVTQALAFPKELLANLKFQKSRTGGVPGIDAKLLAAPGVAQGDSQSVAPSPLPGAGADDVRKDKRKRKDGVPPEKRRKI